LKGSIRKTLRRLNGKTFQWTYFGEGISKAIAIEQQLQDTGQRIEIAAKLQETARSLRQPYIDYIGKLSLKNNSILWWAGSLSEKNPFISKVFLYTCYIKLCQDIISSNNNAKEHLVFFVENRALRRCLIQNLSAHHDYVIFKIESFPHTIIELISDIFGFFIGKGLFVTKSIYRLFLARHHKKPFFQRSVFRKRFSKGFKESFTKEKDKGKGKGLVLLHIWVDHRSFDANGIYHNSYFGELVGHLKNKGKVVIIVPWILDTVSYHETLKRMVQSNENFLVPEAFLNTSDIFRVTLKTILNIPRKRVYPLFKNIEISELIYDNCKNDWINTRVETVLLRYDLVKHWKNAGIPIETFIYTFENHVWEKVYCLALRKFYPKATIIGYQHSAVSMAALNHFFSKDELSILPFPDMVITNGKYPERLFKESGYDSQKVICGGAIRYAYLQAKARSDNAISLKEETPYPVILVTPSAGRAEAAGLVWKVFKGFEHLSNYRIIIKCHPLTSFHSIAKYLGIKSLPPHFIISNKPVSELLKGSDVLLYTDSTTCIEALSVGIPALQVASDFVIDQDPLDFSPDVRMSAYSSEDIVKCVKNMFGAREKNLSERKKLWTRVSSEVFGTVDDSVYDLFLIGGN
jgi:hypothetical protein